VQGINRDRASIVQGADRVGAPATSISVSTTNHNRARERADDRRRRREVPWLSSLPAVCRAARPQVARAILAHQDPKALWADERPSTRGRSPERTRIAAARRSRAWACRRFVGPALGVDVSPCWIHCRCDPGPATSPLPRRLRPAGRPRRLIERPGTPAPLARSAPEAVSDACRSGAAVQACRVAVAVPSLAVIGRPGAGRRWS